MARLTLIFATLVATFSAGTTASAQGLEKPAGYACIPEICIGDGLPEIRKVKFELAKQNPIDPKGNWILGLPGYPKIRSDVLVTVSPRSIVEHGKHSSFDMYRGSPAVLAAARNYLFAGRFDNTALDFLDREMALCPDSIALAAGLLGRFVSGNGTTNIIEVKLTPDEQGSGQSWRVVSIQREFQDPGPMPAARMKEVDAKVDAMYPTTRWKPGKLLTKANSVVYADPITTRHKLSPWGPFKARLDSKDAFLAHPLCASKGVAF